MDEMQAIQATSFLLAVGVALSAFEMNTSVSLFTGNHLMNWKFSKVRSAILSKSALLDQINLDHVFKYQIYLRIGAFILLVIAGLMLNNLLLVIAYFTVFISYLLLSLRSPYGLDGSDQAILLVSTVMLIYFISTTELIRKTVHWFLAAELTVVYITAGWSKIRSENWRNGEYLWKIFSTGFYGLEALGHFLNRHKRLNRILCMGIILLEMSFFLFWIIPLPYAMLFLVGTALFHLTTAIAMGLNTFFWAFLAMYPSTIYCRLLIG